MGVHEVIKAIKEYSRFLITSHIDLEGDAIGSELALAALLRKLGKAVDVVNASATPANYRFLPGAEKIYPLSSSRGGWSSQSRNPEFDAVFVVDCSGRERIGGVTNLLKEETPVINIDHHPGNSNFGRINWVEPKASSVGEMIYRLFKLTRTKLDKKDALNIYTALLTDTGSFRHANTSSMVLEIASGLLKFGLGPAKVYTQVYEQNSAQDVCVAAKISSRISLAAGKRIAWVKIKKESFKRIRGKSEILDKILDFAKSISTVKIVLLFCQLDGRTVKISLRSKSPANVQKIAQFFGGGGHKLASGCTIKASLQEAQQKILRQAKRALLPAAPHSALSK